MAKPVDDLMTSQSIRGYKFPNFAMLDAKIASALERIILNPFFKTRVSLEEQKAQTQGSASRSKKPKKRTGSFAEDRLLT